MTSDPSAGGRSGTAPGDRLGLPDGVGDEQRPERQPHERRLAGKELVRHDPEGIDVGPVVRRVADVGLLGRHVGGRADEQPGRGEVRARLGLDRLGDAEVREEELVPAEEDVLGLHVTVHDAGAVGVPERAGDLLQDAHRLGHRQRPVATEPVAQGLALDVRHGEPQQPRAGARVIHREDVRMLQSGGHADLALEPLGTERGGHLGVEHLDRHRPVVLAVPGEIDRRHAAAAEHAVDGIPLGEGGGEALGPGTGPRRVDTAQVHRSIRRSGRS